MPKAFVGLGANLGQPAVQLQAAVHALAALPDTTLMAQSSCYRSAAIGPQEQPDYCNAVVQLATDLAPHALLKAMQAIENEAGRVRGERWGPRVLDLDLLLYDALTCSDAQLTLPHSQLAMRRFVLQPLAEIAPEAEVPSLGHAAALLAALPGPALEKWA